MLFFRYQKIAKQVSDLSTTVELYGEYEGIQVGYPKPQATTSPKP